MCATMVIPRFTPGQVVPSVMAQVHDAWMADTSQLLEPLMQSGTSFLDRWAAMNYLTDRLPERFTLEQALLRTLESSLSLEDRNQIWNQANRVMRLHAELLQWGELPVSENDMARTTRVFLEALRLWYAEVELVTHSIRWQELGTSAKRAFDQFAAGARDPWLPAQNRQFLPEESYL
jgi:hypothetical protein